MFSPNYRNKVFDLFHQFPCKSPRVFRTTASSQASTERRPPNSNPLPEASVDGEPTSCFSFAVGSNAGFVEKMRVPHLLSQQEMWYFSQHWRELLFRANQKEKIRNTKIKESPPMITRLLYPFNLTTSWRTKNLSKKSRNICNFYHHKIIKFHSFTTGTKCVKCVRSS